MVFLDFFLFFSIVYHHYTHGQLLQSCLFHLLLVYFCFISIDLRIEFSLCVSFRNLLLAPFVRSVCCMLLLHCTFGLLSAAASKIQTPSPGLGEGGNADAISFVCLFYFCFTLLGLVGLDCRVSRESVVLFASFTLPLHLLSHPPCNLLLSAVGKHWKCRGTTTCRL